MSAVANQTKPRTPMGEIAATRIIANWKGDFVADACVAATEFGLLNSGNMLAYDWATNILRLNFDARKVDDIHWSTVYQAFQNGRATVISNIELSKRFLPAAANDNHRFQVTCAPVVVQADTTAASGSNLRSHSTKALESLEQAIEEHGRACQMALRDSQMAQWPFRLTHGVTGTMPIAALASQRRPMTPSASGSGVPFVS